jgi:hypothetical protein
MDNYDIAGLVLAVSTIVTLLAYALKMESEHSFDKGKIETITSKLKVSQDREDELRILLENKERLIEDRIEKENEKSTNQWVNDIRRIKQDRNEQQERDFDTVLKLNEKLYNLREKYLVVSRRNGLLPINKE